MNWALNQQVGAPATKLVLLILANRANHDGVCWPGFGGLTQQTELARRTVITHIRKLVSMGLISIEKRPQPLTNLYHLHLSRSAGDALVQELHGAGAAPGSAGAAPPVVQELHPGSAGAAPEPKTTVSKPKETVKRATRLPDDFELTPERRLVAEAETLPAERTFAKFVNYWRSVSGSRSRKLDWDATWRNWCMTEADRFRPANGGSKPRTKFEEFFGDDDAT